MSDRGEMLNSALRRLSPPASQPNGDLARIDDQHNSTRARAQMQVPSTPEPLTRRNGDVEIDWDQVNEWRRQALDRLEARLGSSGLSGAIGEMERERGRAIIQELLSEHNEQQVVTGGTPLRSDEHMAHARAIFDSMFGLGRLQPLLEIENVENIEITGFDNVVLQYADGRIQQHPAVARNDEELIDSVSFIATWSNRAFDRANPQLDMRLHDGSRLAAQAWISHRPIITIRRHPLVDISLDDLVQLNSVPSDMADLLRAAVRAQKSIVVSGSQGSGKTTLVRALANELDVDERICTIETEYELWLHTMPHRHRRIAAYEARPGGGEILSDGRKAGEVTERDLLYSSFRGNFSRVIVGEVRGQEVVPMIEAMQSGTGSLSTTHAKNARGAIDRLVTAATSAGRTAEFAYRALGASLDLIVQVHLADDRWRGGGRARFITEIVLVEAGGENGMPALTHIYAPGHDQRAEYRGAPETFLSELAPAGLNPSRYRAGDL